MRLNEIRVILKQAIIDMTDVKGASTNTSNILAVTNYSRAINALFRIEPLEIVNTNIDKLKEKGLIYLGVDSPKMNVNDVNFLVNQINLAIAKCQGAVGIIEKQIPQEKKETLAMKLPSSDSYKLFVYTNKQFDKALTLLKCIPELEKKPQISNLDVGSGWIVFCFSVYSGLVIFSKAIDIVNKYRNSKVSKKLAEIRLEEVEVDLEIKQSFEKKLNEEYVRDFGELARALVSSSKEKNFSPEKITSISKAMQIFAEIMDSGASFHQSVLTDKEDEKILPTEEEQSLLPKEYQKLVQQQLLENKLDDK
ncbi:hypothetical protein [Liquorilactobacillus mali]|uniref:Uncharacterized protein n=1 Tax=Liquorilactobacillus mali TaxID=1618 RepID=A0A0R2FT33_9LACO|nr:hypothetical protein [Liquorilactobacillus mali]KRN31625.1 hypothetical protein IV36_GL001749 [Liquorilactobacillus mali]